jgi:phosphatidate cytidylyltransferase
MARTLAERMDPALARRTGSAVVLVLAALVALWLGGWLFVGLVAAAVLCMAYEWGRLAVDADTTARLLLQILCGLFPALAVLVSARGDAAGGLLLVTLAAPLAAAIMALAGPRGSIRAGMGVLYLGLPAVTIVWLRQAPAGIALVLWLLLVVWATDIAAYLFGRAIGGAKLAPAISPGKTWAGLIGGMAGAALVGALTSRAVGGAAWVGAASGCVLAVVAQTGDLFESLMKRRAGVKDSGALIPGHGGALDRLDGLLFTAPAYALLIASGARVVG